MGELMQATPVAVQKMTDCGPGNWWFVHHPRGFLIECGTLDRANHLAEEINTGRAALSNATTPTPSHGLSNGRGE